MESIAFRNPNRWEIFGWTYRKSNEDINTRNEIRVSMDKVHRVPNESIICNCGDKISHVVRNQINIYYHLQCVYDIAFMHSKSVQD